MSSNIAKYKLHDVARKLVKDKYEKEVNNIYNEIVEMLPELNAEVIDPNVYRLYEISSDEVRNMFHQTKYFDVSTWDVAIGSGATYRKYFLKMDMDAYQRLKNAIDGKYVTFTTKVNLLYDNSPKETMIKMMLHSDQLLNNVIKYCNIKKQVSEFEKKLECILNAKKYYPGTLKKDFPEAYEAYAELYPGDFVQKPKLQQTKGEQNGSSSNNDLVDALSEIRNILNS